MLRVNYKGLAVLVGFLSVAQTLGAQEAIFTVGTAKAARGQKATGFLEVPAGVDARTDIPVVVVNGAKPGRVLALVAGAHGTEYASVIGKWHLDRSPEAGGNVGGIFTLLFQKTPAGWKIILDHTS